MNIKIKSFLALTIIASLFFASCEKEDKECGNSAMDNEQILTEAKMEESDLDFEGEYESKVVSDLEMDDELGCYTKGVIEYYKYGKLIAKVDYGDGTKDFWAKIIKDGKKYDFDLSSKKKSLKFKKLITKPLVKIKDCDYIVAGTIKYFIGKNWVATVDFGDGSCDEWATKTWKGGTKTFSLKKK